MAWTVGERINALTRMRRLSATIPTSYTIHEIDGTYYAECNVPGGTEYSGSDAATVTQAAMDALGTDGGKILFKNGTYSFSSMLNGVSNLVIEGESKWKTVLNPTGVGSTAVGSQSIFFDTESNITFRNLNYMPSGSGGAIGFLDTSNVTFENCVMGGSSLATKSASTVINIFGGLSTNYRFTNVEFRFSHGFINVQKHTASAQPNTIPSRFFISDCMFREPTDDGMTIQVDNLVMNNIAYIEHSDEGTGGSIIQLTRGFNIAISNVWLYGRGKGTNPLRIGYDTGTAPYPTKKVVINNVVGYYIAEVLLVRYVSDILINNIQGYNLTGVTGSTVALVAWGDVENIQISNGIVDGITGGQYKYIFSNGTTSGDVTVRDIINYNTGTIDSYWYQTPTGYTLKNLSGYVTENSGTATIANGTSSIQVAHGLAGTPTIVTVTGRHNETVDCYVSARDATNITINVPSNVTADRTVDWYAEYKP